MTRANNELSTLTVKNISFRGVIAPKAIRPMFDSVTAFSHEFEFGKSYLLAGEIGRGGWAVSWILGGLLKQDDGEILRKGITYERRDRQKDSWCVLQTEIKRFGILRNMSLKAQVRHGLRNGQSQYLKSEQEIIEGFDLSGERYNRLLRYFSYEGWRASCAAGLANGKQIFCFPHIHIDRRFYEEAYISHLKKTIGLLAKTGALTIVPANLTSDSRKLCDEVIKMK